MPRLIVNADDLGLTTGVSRAILQAQENGIVTSATLMANAGAFDESVAAILASPGYRDRSLAVGCHIVLIDGVPLSPSDRIKTLLSHPTHPRFRKKLSIFALSTVFGGISVDEVELEATAQIRKIQQTGIELSHVDCHKHTHMFPSVLKGVLRAAKSCGIPAIRNPFEPAFARRIPNSDRTRARETALLRWMWHEAFSRAVKEAGLATTDGSLGVTATGTLSFESFLATIRNLPSNGTYEFVCHPGYNDTDLAAAGTRLLQSRETELQLLCSAQAEELLHSSQVKLVNFWDLNTTAESNPALAHPTP